MNMRGWTPAGPSPQGTNRHMDGERHRRQGTAKGQRGRDLFLNLLSSPKLTGVQEVAGQGCHGQWSAREASSLLFTWPLVSSHKSITLAFAIAHSWHPHYCERVSKECSFQAVQRKGKWSAAVDLLEGRGKGPSLQWDCGQTQEGSGCMARWPLCPGRKQWLGNAWGGYAFWCLMLGCSLSLTWPEPGYHRE